MRVNKAETLRDRRNKHWYIEAQGGMDINGEWQFSGSWKCYRYLFNHPQSRARIVASVIGKRDKTGRVRPYRFRVSLEAPGSTVGFSISRHWCNSLKQARKLADIYLNTAGDTVVKQLFQGMYRKANAKAILQLDGDSNYVPYVTVFGNIDWMDLPTGKYQECGHNFSGKSSIMWEIDRFWHGSSGRGTDEIECWICHGEKA